MSIDFLATLARAINRALSDGWQVSVIGARFSLDDIAIAHQVVEDLEIRDRVALQVVEG